MIVLNGKNNNKEETKIIDGYELGVNSGTVYHCPRGLSQYKLPHGAKALSNEACLDMAATIETLDVPSSFSEFSGNMMALKNSKKLREVHFSEGIKKINPKLFDSNVNFNVPRSVEHLSAGLYVPTEDGKVVIGNQVTSMDSLFASHDVSIKNVEIAGSLKHIPDMAFNQCKNIEKIILHEGVNSSGKDAFRGTNKLRNLEIPESFSGSLSAQMEGRPGTTTRAGKKYSYDTADLENDKNAKMTIKINRSGQVYTFQISRGDFNELSINGNDISFNNGHVKCDISKLTSTDLHMISDGKLVSQAPYKTPQQQFNEKFKDSIIPRGVEYIPQPQEAHTLDELKPTRENLKKANLIINSLEKEFGRLDYLDEGDISDEQADVLTIALHLKYEYFKAKAANEPSAENHSQLKRSQKLIEKLEDEAIIPSYKTILNDDRRNNGLYRKMFDKVANQLESEAR